ncbi:MAG: T9SS type A sorting domain-containing protein [Bacteroidetes bacterium]|nr:T9SS type A sorting domain-containing protein [Bacteroidota bacterium]
MKRIQAVLIFILSVFIYNSGFSQGIIVDDFSLKSLPGWIWGGVEMKYSHQEDNKENGYADIYTNNDINGNGYIGKILLKKSYMFTAGNYVNIMLKGVNNDAFVKINLLYDADNNSLFNSDQDIMLSSKPVSMNFEGWKEIKIKLDQENFEIISKFNDNIEVTEENIYGIQMDFEAGKNYKKSKFESGIALISEIPNKEALSNDFNNSTSKESYFKANNFPNPFNPITTISYNLPQATYVTISVYDRLGRQVQILVDQNQDSGQHSVDFNASEFPSGIYFYRIKTPEKTEVRKMLLAK